MWGYRQTRDLPFLAIGAPTSVLKGNSATVEVTVENKGGETETFHVVLSDLTNNAVIGTLRLTLLSAGSNTMSNTVTLEGAAQPLTLGFLATRDAYKTGNGHVTPTEAYDPLKKPLM